MNVDCSTVGTVAESFKRAIEPGNGASAAKLLPIVRGATFVSGVAATRWGSNHNLDSLTIEPIRSFARCFWLRYK